MITNLNELYRFNNSRHFRVYSVNMMTYGLVYYFQYDSESKEISKEVYEKLYNKFGICSCPSILFTKFMVSIRNDKLRKVLYDF